MQSGLWIDWWSEGKTWRIPGLRIPQCGHLQVQTGKRTDRLKQVGSQMTWWERTHRSRPQASVLESSVKISEMNLGTLVLLQSILSHYMDFVWCKKGTYEGSLVTCLQAYIIWIPICHKLTDSSKVCNLWASTTSFVRWGWQQYLLHLDVMRIK